MSIFKLDLQFFAHKKGGGSASTNRSHDSHSKRLGLKKTDGEKVKAGNIIILQRGTKYKNGENTYLGKNYTVHARKGGIVKYYEGPGKRTYVKVISLQKIVKPAKGLES
jgi:large subunit ribosomal protein L27